MVLLFQKEYEKPILDGIKEWTIRKGDRSKTKKIGSIHKCKKRLFEKDFFARIKIKKLIVKIFGELNEQDAKDDLFNSVEEMKEKLQRINNNSLTDDTLMTKINFELVRKDG